MVLLPVNIRLVIYAKTQYNDRSSITNLLTETIKQFARRGQLAFVTAYWDDMQ